MVKFSVWEKGRRGVGEEKVYESMHTWDLTIRRVRNAFRNRQVRISLRTIVLYSALSRISYILLYRGKGRGGRRWERYRREKSEPPSRFDCFLVREDEGGRWG
jgi:hypothetical protein